MLRTSLSRCARILNRNVVALSTVQNPHMFISKGLIPRVHRNLMTYVSSHCFSTDAKEDDAAAAPAKAKKTWLQVWTDMEMRNFLKPLEEKFMKNSHREKARNATLKCLLTKPEQHLERLTESTEIYVKKYGTKDPYISQTYGEALAQAKREKLNLVCFIDVFSSPPIPEKMNSLLDDGVPVFMLMDYNEFVEGLYDMDTVAAKGTQLKDVSLTGSISGGDLERKAFQALEFLFEGNNVRFLCKSKAKNLSATLAASLGMSKDQFEKLVAERAASMKNANAINDPLKMKLQTAKKTNKVLDSDKVLNRLGANRDKGIDEPFIDPTARRPAVDPLAIGDEDGGQDLDIDLEVDMDRVDPREHHHDDDVDMFNDDPYLSRDADAPMSEERKRKLSKSELAKQMEKDTLNKLNSREKLIHAAVIQATEQYSVLWDLVEYYAKLGAVIQWNRQANQGQPLKPPASDIDETKATSRKEQKKLAAMKKAQEDAVANDPYYVLKYELEVARKAIKENAHIDPEMYEKMLKKNIFIGYETALNRETIVKNNSLHIKLVKQK